MESGLGKDRTGVDTTTGLGKPVIRVISRTVGENRFRILVSFRSTEL